jgi:uncharacterized protein (UPF0276 family)
MIAEARQLLPVAVHFNLVAGNGKILETDWEHIHRCLELSESPYINMHLEARKSDFPGIPVETDDPSHIKTIFQQIVEDIHTVSHHFGVEKIIIENVPYRASNGSVLRPSVEPHLLQQVITETGCGLLFDLSHARIAAYYLGILEREYISALPLNRLCEMHFTGMQWIQGKLTDHLSAQEEDWDALDNFLIKINSEKLPDPWLLAFEYGGVGEAFAWRSEAAVITSQVPRLNEYIHKLNR